MSLKLNFLAATVLAAAALATSAGASTNLVDNGDFSGGYSDFHSDYGALVPTTPPATYSIGTNPSGAHPSWADFGDHTTGFGNMMIVNGAEAAGAIVWGQANITVDAQTTYFFSTWIATTFADAPAELNFSINGANLDSTFTAGAISAGWQQFFASWNSGEATSADIALVNQNLAFNGNDFALDDISLTTQAPGGIPEPASWALMILGFGATGAALRRRRMAAAAA